MNNFIKKGIINLFALTIGASIIPLLNLKIDRWRVLTKDYYNYYNIIRPHPRVNASFLRTQYLIENRKDFDSIIFGSSRIFQGFGTKQLNSSLGGNWYKLTYPGGAPYEHLQNLKAVIASGATIKNVILAIDDADMYRIRDDKKLYNYYPTPTTLTEWIELYIFYLFKPINQEDYNILKGKKKLERSDWTVERFKLEGYKFPIETNPEEHQKRLSNLPAHGIELLEMNDRTEATVSEIENISSICTQNDINFIAFITPRYYKTYLSRDKNILNKYKTELAEKIDYYDFTDFSSLTRDPSLWRDPSHFTADIGQLIVERLESGPENDRPFGKYITNKTIDAHLTNINKSSRALAVRISGEEPNLFIHPTHTN